MSHEPAHQKDLELALRAEQGDPAARERFAARMRCIPSIVAARNASLGRPLHPEDVDDVVQDVVTAVWKKISLYRGEAPLEAWTYQFCLLEIKSFMRRKRVRESKSQMLDEQSSNVAQKNGRREDLYEDIYAGLNKLRPEYAQVLRLKHFSFMTFDEISKRLQVSMNTVKTRYYRGLIKLRGLLDPQRKEVGS